ncbi:SDR family oxidoreductase [Paenibacillus sp. HB172176]|uniref:SDR family oxidoreductase n=1 Tax=Paenibacillus sp. HB172176 TaxID=2493690 RepID=UPI001438ABEF|nr:SDR family oxidoreductase [Paenibacillus sp. HB172176]
MNILITGANRGLGLALAKEALNRGHVVWAAMRGEPASGSELSGLAASRPQRLRVIRLDVTDEASVAAAASRLKEQGAALDVLINNAAILLGRSSTLQELDIAEFERTMDVNLYGPIRMAKHFLPLLRGSGSATIMNISSESGSFSRAYGGDYSYALSKAALNFFNAQLRQLLTDQGIRVFAVHPGWLRTDMGGQAAPADADDNAPALIDLAEGRTSFNDTEILIDHLGHSMSV